MRLEGRLEFRRAGPWALQLELKRVDLVLQLLLEVCRLLGLLLDRGEALVDLLTLGDVVLDPLELGFEDRVGLALLDELEAFVIRLLEFLEARHDGADQVLQFCSVAAGVLALGAQTPPLFVVHHVHDVVLLV